MDNLLFIKANLPATEKDYESGNGEGVFFIVDEATKQAYDEDAKDGLYFGTLDNNSIYWPGLNHGTTCPLEMRGEYRPVVPYQWLKDNYSITGIYYSFDCLDELSDQLFSLEDLRRYFFKSDNEPFTERDIIRIAFDREAELYRETYEKGELIESECIYNPWSF